MFGLGMGELIVIFVVALLVLGPKRLPDIATGLGKAIRDFRKATRDLQDQIEVDDEVRRPMQELRAALRDEPGPLPPLPKPGTLTVTPPVPHDDPAVAPVEAKPGAVVADVKEVAATGEPPAK